MVEGLSRDPKEAADQSRLIGEKILVALNRPYPIANLEHHSTPSIGVTLFSDQQNTADELLKRADLAMYKAC
jgi:GGDEF domain-containing protein